MLKYIGLTKSLEDRKQISEQFISTMAEMKSLSENKIEGIRYPTLHMEANNVTMQDAVTMQRCLKVLRTHVSKSKVVKPLILTVTQKTVLISDSKDPKIVQLLTDKLEDIIVKEVIEIKKPDPKTRRHVDFVRYRMSIMLPTTKGLHFLKMPYNVFTWAKANKYPITSANNSIKDRELLRRVILWVR